MKVIRIYKELMERNLPKGEAITHTGARQDTTNTKMMILQERQIENVISIDTSMLNTRI
jgi:hypothetical protein